MPDRQALEQNDPLLWDFLCAADSQQAELHLASLLVAEAASVINKVIPWNLYERQEERESLLQEAQAQIISRLRKLKTAPAEKPVRYFSGYVASVSDNVFKQYLGQQNPQRYQHRRRIMYVFRSRAQLGHWPAREHSREVVCGRKTWSQREDLAYTSPRHRELLESPQIFAGTVFPNTNLYEMALFKVVEAIFDWLGHPLRLEDLIKVTARLWHAEGTENIELDAESAFEPKAQDLSPEAAFEHKVLWQRLWEEICALPQPQRVALLLSLRNHNGATVLDFFPLHGVAGYRDINRILDVGWSDEEFAHQWQGFPLDDLTIGGLLGITRQEVINKRASARKRLSHRFPQR